MRADLLISIMAVATLSVSACGQSHDMGKNHASGHSDEAHQGEPATTLPSTISVTPPADLAPGKLANLTLTLKDSQRAPLGPDAIATSHTQKVHVMIVDPGLEDYSHVHATPSDKPGEWAATFTPKFGRTYKVWADFKLAEKANAYEGHDAHEGHDTGEMAHHVTPSTTLKVGNDAAPAITAIQALSGSAGGLSFALSLASPAKLGETVMANLVVTDVSSGQPFTQLEPIMGAYAHLVGFSADGSTMLHGHPEGNSPTTSTARGGPNLTFELHPGAAGPTRLFLQVQKGGQVLLVPFTIVVAPKG